MLRITAVSAGAVEYLLRGSGCAEHDHGPEHEHGSERTGPEPERDTAAGYFAAAIEHGEPAGRWVGGGIEALGLSARVGDVAAEDVVRAVFGQLRHPESTEKAPVYLGQRPRLYKTGAERVAAALAKEPDASPERRREVELAAATDGRKAVAYYDLTFSPPKSVSVYYAALLATGATEEAAAVAAAHDQAVEIALGYAEKHVAYTRTGYHGRTAGGVSVGRYEKAIGVAGLVFRHSTSRESEPQLHTHAAVLNRVATAAGHIGALDGKAFRPIKEAIATAYERAVEQLVGEATGAVFEMRPDGKAREIVGVDPELCQEASTRRAQVDERVAELIESYVERHGYEPDAAARKDMAQMATLDTRRPKDELAGPVGVAMWGQARRERCEATVEAVADAAELAAEGAPGGRPVIDLPSVLGAAVADVQAQYATWTLGNLVDAIDDHLGPAGALGVSARQRAEVVEAMAGRAVAADNDHGVLLLTAPDPVEVPQALRRGGPDGDGRSIYRPHMDERYATADQLATEERLTVLTRRVRAPRVEGPQLEALRVELSAAGLSPDQVAAVAGILGSGRAGDVLVGPAGAGKSHTVGQLARVWGETHGRRVLGLATSEIATKNLRGDGLDALNTSRFLATFTPDPDTGRARDRLRAGDLVIVDEAGMSSTRELAAITELVTEAGGKVLFTGDHHQLDAVGAGGMFAHLVRHNGAFELERVHRFTNDWEGDASLRLRAGDKTAIADYADRGRLRVGTLEEMQEAAVRGYLADTVAGYRSLLIVGTNAHAAELSRSIREQLVALRRVAAEHLLELPGGTKISVGDVIQTRRNDYQLRVDPNAQGVAMPVTNREIYTVIGRDAEGQLLARDSGGAVAHLPAGYVEQHVTLAYAVTGHAAQGLTVDTNHPILDRDVTREVAYPALTRGRESNIVYLVTERRPDAHNQERVAELPAERLAAILDNSAAQQAATHLRDVSARDAASLAVIGTQWDAVTAEYARDRYTDTLLGLLGLERTERLAAEWGFGRLIRAVREAELAGHNTDALLTETVRARSLDSAESVSDVLRWRVRAAAARRAPEQRVDPANWTTLAAPIDGPVGQFAHELAVLASDRQAQLGHEAAVAAPDWATAHLGPVPDGAADPAGRAEWQRRVGIAAAYRELRNIDPEQLSLGAAPTREQEFHRALWRQAAEALGRPDDMIDYRALSDAELYAIRERWVREQAWAPAWVAEELATTHQLAREHRETARLSAAQLATMAAAAPGREELVTALARAERLAGCHEERVGVLEAIHAERRRWSEVTAPAREADQLAADELAHRNLPAHRPTTQPAQPDLTHPVTLEPQPSSVEPAADRERERTTVTEARPAARVTEWQRIARAAARWRGRTRHVAVAAAAATAEAERARRDRPELDRLAEPAPERSHDDDPRIGRAPELRPAPRPEPRWDPPGANYDRGPGMGR